MRNMDNQLTDNKDKHVVGQGKVGDSVSWWRFPQANGHQPSQGPVPRRLSDRWPRQDMSQFVMGAAEWILFLRGGFAESEKSCTFAPK